MSPKKDFSHEEEQMCWFYNKKWQQNKDKLLIQVLLSKKEACKPQSPADSPHAIVFAMDALNNTYKAGLRVLDVAKRIAFLRKRYITFKQLTDMAETRWELPRNVVHADEAVWIRLFEEKRFYQAYHHRGEPEIARLELLFGSEEGEHSVIDVDNGGPLWESDESTEVLDDDSSDDDIVSPLAKAAGNVVRKLFDDGASSSVVPETPVPPTDSNAPLPPPPRSYGLASTHGFPGRNVFPKKPTYHSNAPESDKGGSP